MKRRTRTHGLATGLDFMSSRERTPIEGTHRLSFLGSRVAMFATWDRGMNATCNLPFPRPCEHKEKVGPVFAWDLVVRPLALRI